MSILNICCSLLKFVDINVYGGDIGVYGIFVYMVFSVSCKCLRLLLDRIVSGCLVLIL